MCNYCRPDSMIVQIPSLSPPASMNSNPPPNLDKLKSVFGLGAVWDTATVDFSSRTSGHVELKSLKLNILYTALYARVSSLGQGTSDRCRRGALSESSDSVPS